MRSERKTRHRKRFDLRKRTFYLIALMIVMLLGLASRAYAGMLPEFWANHAGDALWAALVYLLVRMLIPGYRTWICALGALLLSFGIEFSQLYRAEWLDALRSTTLGALVLGRGFLAVDLVRYAAGIIVCWGADISVLHLWSRNTDTNSSKEENR
ncbi:ribosomal maturation YjgA family protein [Saccharibacillus endophyticus]|uniref:DUF2809 domain-containing protein n=1 Tax=Saccharibacillus endophyticus TaxID=2060666 RepID=A0ABQ2A475_9BACL|nr:DUF2809 domain-containing protein [Saccharibacillus endophyticus]GGH84481.1 hypothetical protein GCM10007362_39650 [Saccharibacillus endophyticus]